jgi:hypothetical protein
MTDRFTRGLDHKRHKGIRMGTLYANLLSVEGEVTLSLMLDELSLVAKADLLSDWIGLLEREYSVAIGEMREAFDRILEDQE